MTHQRGNAEIVFSIILLVIAFVAWVIIANLQCKAKWERSGMAGVTWGPIQGCLVQLPDGRWLPEERVREIDLPKISRLEKAEKECEKLGGRGEIQYSTPNADTGRHAVYTCYLPNGKLERPTLLY